MVALRVSLATLQRMLESKQSWRKLMKAIVYTKYGPPDVLQLEEVPKPTPKDDEVLVKVHAASVNAWDWDLLRGTPFVNRLTFGLLKPKIIRPRGQNKRPYLELRITTSPDVTVVACILISTSLSFGIGFSTSLN